MESLCLRKSKCLTGCSSERSDVATENDDEQSDRECYSDCLRTSVEKELQIWYFSVDCFLECSDAE